MFLVIFAGCNIADWVAEEFPYPIDEYQYSAGYGAFGGPPSAEWHALVGADVQKLIEARGEPDFVLEARPKYGEYRYGIPAMTYVYRPSENGRECYEAYVVVLSSKRVSRYYCR